jgi:hypothetical protein
LKKAFARASVLLDAAALLLLASAAAHTWGPFPHDLGLHISTLLSRAIWGGAALLEFVPMVRDWEEPGAVVSGLTLAAFSLAPSIHTLRDRRDHGDPEFLAPLPWPLPWLVHAAAVPAVPGLIALIAWGAGQAPAATLLSVLLLMALSAALPRSREASGPLSPPAALPRGRWRLAVAVALGGACTVALHGLYVSGPGIQPLLVRDAGFAPIAAAALGGLPPDLRDGPALPLLGTTLGFALAALLVTRGTPLLPRLCHGPAAWCPPLLVLAVASAGAGLPAWAEGVWTCPGPESPVQWITRDPGIFQLDLSRDYQLWATVRDERRTRRFDLRSGAESPTIDWGQLADGAWPEEQFIGADVVWTALVGSTPQDGSLLWPLSALDGTAVGVPIPLPGCFVASEVWLPELGRWLLGCEYGAQAVLLPPLPASRVIPERIELDDHGSIEEIVRDPEHGLCYSVPLWGGDELLEIDPGEVRVRRRAVVGDFQWGLAIEPRRRQLWVPRFQEGRLVEWDLDRLRPVRAVEVGWGIRPTVVVPESGWVLTAGTYSGRLWAVDLDGGRETRSLPVGGMVRDIVWDPDGRRLFFAGRCGLGWVDASEWPGSRP